MMIQHLSHVAMECVECPVCGRPVEIEPGCVSRELACGHCHGRLGALDSARRVTFGNPRRGEPSLETARRPRAAGAQRVSVLQTWKGLEEKSRRRGGLSRRRIGARGGRWAPSAKRSFQPDGIASAAPVAVLVEHRDEVFARLATDLAERSVRVIRARTAAEAVRLSARYVPELIVANADLPGESGWLLAAKLRLADPHTPLWLYNPKASSYDRGMAKFLQVQRLIPYRGDLFDLSRAIARLMDAAKRPSKPSVRRSASDGLTAA